MAKKIKSRILLKTGTTSDWETASERSNFTPLLGEVCIYTDAFAYQDGESEYYIPGVKIGDGTTGIEALPFINNARISKSDIDALFTSQS